MKRVCNVLELCLLPCIVDHFQNEGKYKLYMEFHQAPLRGLRSCVWPRKYLQAQVGLVNSIHPSFTLPSLALTSRACTSEARWRLEDAYTIWNKIGTLFKQDSETQQSQSTDFTQRKCMNAKVCGHHCIFLCRPNLGCQVPLWGNNLYGGRERVDVRLPLGFWRMSRIRSLNRND